VSEFTIMVQGIPELQGKLERMKNELNPDETEPILVRAAEIMANTIRARAPVGPTGNLRRGVVAKALQRREKQTAAIAAMDYRIAPHAHFLEAGTKYMAARPFFGPGVAASRGEALETIISEISRSLEKA